MRAVDNKRGAAGTAKGCLALSGARRLAVDRAPGKGSEGGQRGKQDSTKQHRAHEPRVLGAVPSAGEGQTYGKAGRRDYSQAHRGPPMPEHTDLMRVSEHNTTMRPCSRSRRLASRAPHAVGRRLHRAAPRRPGERLLVAWNEHTSTFAKGLYLKKSVSQQIRTGRLHGSVPTGAGYEENE